MVKTQPKVHMLILAVTLAVALLVTGGEAQAALWLSDTVTTTENFDGMGTGQNTPTDWRIDSDPVNFRTVGTWAAAQSHLLQIPPDPTGSAGGNIYNWWCGADNITAGSRSPGWLSSSATCRSGNLYAQLVNRADTLSGITVSYDTLKFRNGDQVGGWTIQLFYSTDGTSWNSAGADFNTLWPNDGNTDGYGDCPAETQSVVNKRIYVQLSKGDTLYLCWNYSVTSASSSSNGMGLGVDNVSFSGIAPGAAELMFNEFNKNSVYGSDTPWIEFKVRASGVLSDTLWWSRSTSTDTYYVFGSGQSVTVGDYVVLWFETGADDVNKADGESANAWDVHLNYASPQNADNCYAVYASGSTTMSDFFAWAALSTAIKSSCSEAIQRAYHAGEWDTFGPTPDCFDAPVSYNANGNWGIQRDPSGTDTNSKYGWCYYTGPGTPGAVNPAFHSYAGEGAWAVAPALVNPSATETICVSYVVTKHDFGNADHPGGYITMTVPSGWTAPQNTSASAAGFVSLYDPNGMAYDLNPSSSKVIIQDRTVIVALGTDSTLSQDSITIVYGAATTPVTPGAYTFTLASDPWGSNVRDLDSSPSVTVGTPPQVILRDVPTMTLPADTRNATLLSGRIVGDAAGDTLLGLTVTNLGTATSSDTADSGSQGGLSLWLDTNGDSWWDTGDSWVATLNYRGAWLWGFSSSTVLMPDGVFNFVVTTNIGATPTDGHTFQLRIAAGNTATFLLGAGPAADTTNTGIQTISYAAAYVPFVWSVTLDSHSVSKLLAEQTYSCTVVYGDSNGYAEIDSCVVLINSAATFAAGDSCAYFKFVDTSSHFFVWNDTTQAWVDCGDTSAFTATGNNYVTLTGGTVSRSGTTLTVGWVFRPKFGWEDEACNVYVDATDSVPSSPGWQNRASATTENDLAFTGQAAVTSGYHGALSSYGATWVRTGETLTWSGLTVVYQGTAVSPDNAYFDIRIADTDASTDTVDITGVLDTVTVAGNDAGVDTYRFTIVNRPGGSDVSDTWFTLRIDPLAPTTIASLAAASSGADTVRLTWTALTHDGLSPFVRYEVYWDTASPVTTGDSLWTSSNHALLSAIGADSTIVTGLWSSATYYFAIRGVDTAGNVGVLSNEVNIATGDELWGFTVSAPATARQNDSFSVTITALNRLGATYTGFDDTVYLRVDTGSIYPVATTGFVAGVKTLDVQMDSVGPNVIHASAGDPDAIFFSEYYVGTVNDKYLEIFNGTGKTLNLGGYMLVEYNGNGTVYFAPLVGSVAPNDVFGICHSSADAGIRTACDLETSTIALQFNGDDDIVLWNAAGDTLDIIGDSSSSTWGSGVVRLVRKSWVTIGDRNSNDVFDRTVEWDVTTAEDWSTLGAHTWASVSGMATGTTTITITLVPPVAVHLKNTAADTLYPDSRNATLLAGRIVGDASGDTLLGLTVSNLGTATSSDTADSGSQGGLSLWLDVDGDSTWDTGDSWVATLNYRGAGLWGFSASTVLMPGGVFNFVVTTNIGSAPTDLHTFRLGFIAGNALTSLCTAGPSSDTYNTETQTISNPPVVYQPGDIIFSEISWGGVGGAAGTEWFELYNPTVNAISLSGWTVSDDDGGGCTHTFGAVTVPARGYVLIEASEGATSVAADDIYGDDAGNLNLAAGGDNLFLRSAGGVTIDAIDFSAAWPAGAAAGGLGSGFVSMERRDLDTNVESGYGSNWLNGPYTVACGALGGVSGTPGAANSMAYYDYVKVNEVLINDPASPDNNEWVEIHNACDTPVNVYGWEVTDYSSHDKTLPQVAIPPRGFIVVHYASGTDDTQFATTNSVLHLYTGAGNVLTNTTRDAIGLHTGTTPDSHNTIDFVAWAVTPGTDHAEAQTAVDAGQWPSLATQVDIADVIGRTVFRYTDGADSNATDTGDWTQLANNYVNHYSCGGPNASNRAVTLTGASGCTVIATTSDATGYRGAVGDTALIRLTGTDNDPACTNVTTCTVVSSASDATGEVVITLRETGLNTGIFEGYLFLHNTSDAAMFRIGASTGEIVTIRSVEDPSLYDTIVIGQASGINGIVINEFLANSGGTSDTEYIELYNNTDTDVYIAGCWLDDIMGGGSAAYQIPVTATAADTIPARGFRTYWGATTGIVLNNTNDEVHFCDVDGVTCIDQRVYATADYAVSEGRCHDGSIIWTLFDGVNDPGQTPDSTNNPAPVITQVAFSSDQPSRFYWNTVQDTSVPGGGVAATCTFSSSGVAQNITCTVYAIYAYNDATGTGSDVFGDGVQTAAQTSMPYTVTYSIEAGAATQNLAVTVVDTCGAGDSLTIRFAQDNTAPSAPANLTATADTAAPDTGVWLAWSSVSGDTVGYYVYADTDGNGQAQRLSGLLTDTTGWLADSRYVTLGETFVFFVVCVDSVGNESLHSDTAQAPILIPYKLRDTVSLSGTPVPARPGATVAWRLGVRNAGFGPASNVVITDAISADVEYKVNSADTVAARGYQATIEYSHDSGAAWDTSQAAPVTNIRWTFAGYQYTDSIIEVKFETFIR